ncbi:segregation/condensation protein A [Guyparkeria halophila]|uniref:Segregation and condensation protein A n=1 Tax=Guyparkeria halophila TaxID=47960 RepID=A0A6I6CZA0_9GAMM|nr:ScpA family protein [Guyparkeria halophila]QGT77968.1 segregation/condensation protein A [Guyparkeria halophila]
MSSEAHIPADDSRRWVDATPRVSGQPLEQLPLDLYIPADALAIWLEQFEGPLDLLLYLIRKHNIDILEIPVARVTEQYLEYLALMKSMAIELAAEYLLMAAWLAEIKSRMLLPPEPREDDEEEPLDPRAELVERLLEYERTTRAAGLLDERPRRGRDWFALSVEPPEQLPAPPVPADLAGLIAAMNGLLREGSVRRAHHVRAEGLSIRQRMTDILDALADRSRCELAEVFRPEEGRMGVAVTTVAVLELSRTHALDWSQDEPFGPVTLFRLAGSPAEPTVEEEMPG